MGALSRIHFPERFVGDESNTPSRTGDRTEAEWQAHDRWVQESCDEGFLVSEFLGNITRAKNVRDFLRGLQREPGPEFPILLKNVVYDGTQTGDWIPVKLREMDRVLDSRDILIQGEKESSKSMKRLCEASIATGNPIVF